MSIGGAIGTGLFMGAGKTISVSGTSILLTYMTIGFFLFFTMRAMGEILLSNLQFKSFSDFCSHYIGPWAGYFISWSYSMTWVVVAIADCTVIGGYLRFWLPDLPLWIPALLVLATLLLMNLVAVIDAGIQWIGPPPEVMRRLGNKVAARNAAIDSDVPVMPATEPLPAELEECKRLALEVGYPLMLKASWGGSGRGMRVLESEQDLENALGARECVRR